MSLFVPPPPAAPPRAAQARYTVRAFVVAAAFMFAYEALKTSALPQLSMWESHAITILVGAVTAAVVAHVAMGRHGRALAALAEAEARREGAEAHQAALAESEARYRLLVEASPEAIAVHRAGRLLYVNAAGAAMLGLDGDAALRGRTTDDFVHADDLPRLIAGGREREGRLVDFRLLRPDGRAVEVEAVSVRITYEGRTALQTVFRDVSERKRLEAQLVHQAFHDPLTGLANRALFRDRVEHALERQGRGAPPLAVLFLDLDDFKAVNDRLGHGAGDRLLVGVAERLRRATRGYDTVARLGGDEFAVLLEESASDDDALTVVRRVTRALAHPFALDGREVAVTASVGLAHAAPGDDAEALLRNADVAMYQAKGGGKARHAVFEAAMYEAVIARLELEADLRQAVDDPAGAGFWLAYQPVVDLDTGRVASVEALLRWRHPRRGPLPPAAFVPVAEDTGLIAPLGAWVLRAACAELARWRDALRGDGRGDAALPGMAVNLSARQLERPELADEVAAALAAADVPAGALTLEITESTLMARADETLGVLRALKALGVRLAIDDFGTGYSSLSHLQRFPVDVLKIDRAFVDGLGRGGSEAALARTIVALGEALRLRTVAEGVESAAQRDELRALGCQQGQGYLFARPQDGGAVLAALLNATAGVATAGVDTTGVVTASLKPEVER
jgi:diguanylate cyclase (GGDEF)-like protein/PAS domain S-box-containing protein